MLKFRLDDTEIPAAKLVHGLYHATFAVGLGLRDNNPGLSVRDVEKYLESCGDMTKSTYSHFNIDYFHGRPIKLSFERDDHTKIQRRSIALYDRDAGEGVFMSVVNQILEDEVV